MEKNINKIDNVKPQESFEITDEGIETSLAELIKKVENDPLLAFVPELKDYLDIHDRRDNKPDLHIYVVGGSVRDAILDHPSDDYDLLVDGVDKNMLESFFSDYGKTIDTRDASLGTYKFVPNNQPLVDRKRKAVDIAVPRTEVHEDLSRIPTSVVIKNVDVEQDLARRDFTCNAMALEVFFDGKDKKMNLICDEISIEDIQNKVIRSVGNPYDRFADDPLRILRAVRLACKLDFAIDDDTMSAMQDLAGTVDQSYIDANGIEKRRLPFERFSKEVKNGVDANPLKYIELLDKAKLLQYVFPEVAALDHVAQSPDHHSEGNAFEHTKLVIKNLPEDAPLPLKLAAIFHDTGKSDTTGVHKNDPNKITFYGHDESSATKTKDALSRLCFKSEIVDDTVWLVKNHMKMLFFVDNMSEAKRKQYISHRLFPELVMLARADDKSSLTKPNEVKDDSFYCKVGEIVQDLEKSEKGVEYVDIINGKDIINLFGADYLNNKHGKLIGVIKDAINYSYNNGQIESRDAALKQAESMIKEKLADIAN